MSRRFARVALGFVTLIGAAGLFTASAVAAPGSGSFVAIPGSVSSNPGPSTGSYSAGQMTVQVVLAPSNQARLQTMLRSVNDPSSSSYQHWLAAGQFDADFAPASGEAASVTKFLKASGLTVGRSSSPFLVDATGSSAQVSSAFKTSLRNYVGNGGARYFSNATPAEVPSAVASGVLGVVGLSNTVRPHSSAQRSPAGTATPTATNPNCETAYPTRALLFSTIPNNESFPYGYGGGPGCSGLTPSQDNSIYDAPSSGNVKGGGENLAVFELSAYKKTDIDKWASTFYGSGYTPPLDNVMTDGGPLNVKCPSGDQCPPQYEYYSGDIEVDADIEMQLAIAPQVKQLTVYEAPNDFTGQTELDQYNKIARSDKADSVSSSWGLCENDAGTGYAQAENEIYEQMALQGQSLFNSAGDTGAFDCIRSDGTTVVNVMDPASQPWVTSVGGTSLEGFNPGDETNPAYPLDTETVWNVDNLCNEKANEGGLSGYTWCAATGAGGGGISQFWGRPYYQAGPGVNNAYTEYGNGSTQCVLAANGTPCREVPDISMNADEYTPYAEYCTGGASTPYSVCGTFSAGQNAPGWFGIGGTSLSSPFMSAIIADRDGYQGHRTGNANPLLYGFFDQNAGMYFHDITSAGQTTTNNGLYPTTPGYDLATGIGTSIMAPLITSQG